MTSVVLVDDDPLVRDGLRVLLQGEPGIVVAGEAADGERAIQLVIDSDPDVVVMDVRMPRLDGIEATRRLSRRDPGRPRVVVLTTFEHDDYVYEALRAGAAGFVVKRHAADQLAGVLRAVAAGDVLLFPAEVRELARRSPTAGRDTELAARIAELTPREAEVLRLVTDGLTNAEIATRLVVTIETIKTHVAAVLAKLGARSRTEAVIAAYESGFVVAGAG